MSEAAPSEKRSPLQVLIDMALEHHRERNESRGLVLTGNVQEKYLVGPDGSEIQVIWPEYGDFGEYPHSAQAGDTAPCGGSE